MPRWTKEEAAGDREAWERYVMVNAPGRQPMVAIVMVNWDRYDDTAVCLDSIENLSYRNYHVIIVDNGSRDDSEAKLRRNYAQHTILQAGANLGFAGGSNLGICRARELNADYILLLNNDTEVDQNLLTELVTTAERDEKYGIIGGKICYLNPRHRVWACGGCFNVNTGDARHFQSEREALSLRPPQFRYVPGCLLLIKRRCLEEIGFLSEEFFHLCEDVEYCLRAARSGWGVTIAPNAVIYHKGSASLAPSSPLYHYYEQRNRLYVMEKYGDKRKMIFPVFRKYIAIGVRFLTVLLLSRNLTGLVQNIKSLALAVSDYSMHKTGRRF